MLLGFLLTLYTAAQAVAEKVVTLTFAGDCTLGCEELTRGNPDSFDAFVKEKGYGYFFENFRDLFSGDDCTVVNLEGVLSDHTGGEVTGKAFRFRGAERFVNILKEGSVEAVSLANNHTKDYSLQGLKNTMRVLDEAGIGWARDRELWFYEKDGIRIAFVSVDYYAFINSAIQIRDELLKLRKNGEINAAVLLMHQGNEYEPKHSAEQRTTAEFFISKAKVDLVVAHHPHVLQGIGIIDNRTVLYSLGNFVFGGYSAVSRGPATNSLYTAAARAEMHFSDDGEYIGQRITLYPAYDSGKDPANNYQPVRVNTEDAAPVIEAIQQDTPWQLPEAETDSSGMAVLPLEYLAADSAGE